MFDEINFLFPFTINIVFFTIFVRCMYCTVIFTIQGLFIELFIFDYNFVRLYRYITV